MRTNHKSNNSNKISPAIWLLTFIITIGYVLIIISNLTVHDSTSLKEQDILELHDKINTLEQSLMTKEKELKQLKSKLVTTSKKEIDPNKSNLVSTESTFSVASRPGVIILGMHRSGTSALGGLINMMGLKTGGPLIQAAEDNAKGFFERIDVVLQNDQLMQSQRVHYSHRTYSYDPLIGVKDVLSRDPESYFKEGRRGLAFLNNRENYPWMLKDPRLCITLRTWLPLLNFIPAVLFTYRHPFDVAMSMHKREFEQFKINKGLRLWYVYNKRAIEQSSDLCRVVTSHRKVMKQPEIEFERIFVELKQCGVDVPHKLTSKEIASFIDIKLQHGRSTLQDSICEKDLSTITPPESWPTTEMEHIELYRECMRVYCAMENGEAFHPNFKWNQGIKDD